MIRNLLALLVIAAACGKPAFLPVGTRVPLRELHGPDLRAFIVAEIDRNQPARAYFALDLMKTRPYIEQQLDTDGAAQATARLADLRPLVGELVASSTGRGIKVVKRTQQVPISKRIDDAYWSHVTKFESRVNQINDATPGIPYSYAARRAYGVTSAEETTLVFSEGEAFISFVVHGERAFGFVIVDGKLVVRQLALPVTRMRESARRLVDGVRAPGGAEWKQEATELYTAILGPFAAELKRTTALFVSPDGFLANLPFALLLEGGKPIIDRLRITYLPSASVYRQLISRPILNDAPRLLAIGNPTYPSGVPPLPFAEREASTVSELFPSSLLLAGADATEGRTITLAPKYNILHFATHGMLLGHIARDASSLLLAAHDERDGFLNAAEIASLDLSRTYIAVLSACETAVSESTGGSIDLGSITNAFLSAGVPSVIGSLWQVEDEATTVLMLQFYKRFLEVGAGEALRQAMLELKKSPRFEHPFFWAAFTLYGWDK
jgi:CHAT domain-containing protein